MLQSLPIDEEFKEAFIKTITEGQFSNSVKEISKFIFSNHFDRQGVDVILQEYHVKEIQDIKEELLDLLLSYINLIIQDNFISENESKNLKFLKRLFKIQEGDFYNLRYKQIEEILDKQFQFIYSDNQINTKEALHKVGLQELFDLSYDQFLELVDKEVKAAMERGANADELDTVFLKAYQIKN